MLGVPWSKAPGRIGIQPKSVGPCTYAWKRSLQRSRLATGKHAHQVVVAIARELSACMWAIAKQVAGAPNA